MSIFENVTPVQVGLLVFLFVSVTAIVLLPSKKKRAKQKESGQPVSQASKGKEDKTINPLVALLVKLKIIHDPSNQVETTQEWLDVEHIYPNGLTLLKDGTYTAVMELTQINQRLNNVDERAATWTKFRNIINAVNIRYTLLVQSHYLDINNYIQKFDKNADEVPNLTKELSYFKDDIIKNYEEFAEMKTREYRSYAIFRFNPHREGMEKSLQSGNAVIDDILNTLKGTAENTKVTQEEARDLADTILEEICDMCYSIYNTMGIKSLRLNRAGVYSMVYATLNRDLSNIQHLSEASNAGAFTEFKETDTPYLIEEEFDEEITHLLRQKEVVAKETFQAQMINQQKNEGLEKPVVPVPAEKPKQQENIQKVPVMSVSAHPEPVLEQKKPMAEKLVAELSKTSADTEPVNELPKTSADTEPANETSADIEPASELPKTSADTEPVNELPEKKTEAKPAMKKTPGAAPSSGKKRRFFPTDGPSPSEAASPVEVFSFSDETKGKNPKPADKEQPAGKVEVADVNEVFEF